MTVRCLRSIFRLRRRSKARNIYKSLYERGVICMSLVEAKNCTYAQLEKLKKEKDELLGSLSQGVKSEQERNSILYKISVIDAHIRDVEEIADLLSPF